MQQWGGSTYIHKNISVILGQTSGPSSPASCLRQWPIKMDWEKHTTGHNGGSIPSYDPGVFITYTISGQGVTEPPYGIFVVNGKTGQLNVTGIVDREQTPMLYLRGYALDQNGKNLEKPLDLRIKVMDINDNYPVFSEEVFVGSVEELCEGGTLVMRINATDADEPNNLNSKIAFRIVSQEPSQHSASAFQIKKETGEVRTATLQLDREEYSSYSLVVEAKDRGGDSTGNGKQTAVQIKILDVNDNIPVLEKQSYEGSVKENTANVEVMRMKVFDRDEQFTDNWLANFVIVSGNEGGYFRIETDSQTNEGILTLVKEINYEELQNLNLNIIVSNKAAYHKSIGSSYQAKPIPVKIKVENVKEGPIFKPQTLVINGSESMKINHILGRFQAFDEDTGKIAERITYAVEDAGNWITINSKTAEIKLNKVLDYESRFVINGTYTAKILAITDDFPRKTATGTIAIQIKDINNHCPTLETPVRTECLDATFINVTAVDRDAYPNGAPFTFTIIDEPEGMAKEWKIGQVEGNSMQLISQDMKPGYYQVPILVKDNQGFSCPEKQILQLTLCICSPDGACQERIVKSSVKLGPGAIFLIILAFLLLLLLPLLLLLCYCGRRGAKGFTAIPDSSEEMLRKWNNEGAAPEDKVLDSASKMTSGAGAAARVGGAAGTEAGISGGGGSTSWAKEHYSKTTRTDGRWEDQRALLSGGGYGALGAGQTMIAGSGGAMTMEAGGTTMNEEFLRNYFSDKAVAFAEEDEAQLGKDCLLVYSQEEEGSPHGSVGCCSFIEGDFDDNFLDDLVDKFKTLADICMGKHVETYVGQHSFQALKDKTPNSRYHIPEPVRNIDSGTVGQETVAETSFASRSGIKPARPIPDPLVNSNVRVTETSYGAGSNTVFLDPQFKESVVVTERVLAPASGLQDMFEIPAVPGSLKVQDFPDNQYVVVRERERLLVPSSDLKAPLSIPNLAEGQNVIVTERVVTPTPGLQANNRIPAEGISLQSMMDQPAFSGGGGRQEFIQITDPLFNQGSLVLEDSVPSNSTLSKSSRVSKYSTVQYTRS
uniref:Desmoglein 2 n=1 Tax=Sphenodon punctatus TaxID=8508 RepID=A0A8D0GQB8_SPHPU